ncbi:phosphoribosylformylglycinamidine synthase subunit PurS [candidate division WOR-1 bacterium RIFOXYA12_FULL_43_27]|uniref:Phosphoribosylformylglycinamidine synthase subunit PurS n=1 Tax=candidate division WOR-1 bacterium RIFOXYC2_FULL_46_14 TaxID=1802587 RepID=A0A1F4U847_UNCSA|nr:MAG: phosphoribosylformylglycinamidine synthase subunit PurS [candidate division WOR-1 bacterium RIFOXYA12_FULL_43_27]OGC20040.1 MAG: phosphoribosylformylglycinamidine synthase subunit PurS [candidate division WOR-1 bacterium RIFOXYB2_FULL_46_45]OGC32224.1 MAG: phosphoribosylformylglycinamidine synthase subunit PurS [candidate division WOR-1 bacterium RIFOXYA2_FULL_46_56]OGC41128.1 MAG: phosphoribosylformylglycinamidine synthase subunit PurS [candidate division WOR-1 bacterium RIFOXYC2_FULL_4
MADRKVKVYIKNKKGVLNPQGKTVESALHSLGYKNVSEMRVGKYIEFRIPDKNDAKKQVDEMCRKLLANPVIEEYRFEIE